MDSPFFSVLIGVFLALLLFFSALLVLAFFLTKIFILVCYFS